MVLLEGLHPITKDTSFWVFGLIWSDVKHSWVSGHDPSRAIQSNQLQMYLDN